MISKKAKKYLDGNMQNAADWDGIRRKVILEQDAIKAVELAEQKMKDKAIKAHRKSCFYLCTDNKCTSFVHNVSILHTEYGKCNGDCLYMKNFKELLNN
jgi:hypothetical protein